MNKKIFAIIVLAAGLASCSNNEVATTTEEPETTPVTTPRHDITLSRAEQEILNGETAFAFNLFGKIAEERSGTNLIIAPYNLATALSMVANGADGDVRNALIRALGSQSLEDLNAINKRLIEELTTLDPTVTMKVANSIWGAPEFTYAGDFSNRLLTDYKAESMTADLSTTEGINAFNEWCSRATDGMIPKALEGPRKLEFMIASANLFKGLWYSPFKKEDTRKDEFRGASGKSRVDMMSQKGGFASVAYDGCVAARMYYGNTAFRMTVILPDEEVGINGYLSTLTPEKWEILSRNFNLSDKKIFLPKFRIEDENMLSDAFSQMIPEAFGPSAKFSGIAAEKEVKLSLILQKAVIDVDEAGTKAAAVTIIGDSMVSPSSNYREDFRADRPFIFIIDETSTGAILFMGMVNNL